MKMKRILVVDDKEENRYMLSALLQGNGYQVRCAVHGAEALELARREPPDLVITDILMPVMDGFALCREWKKDPGLKSVPLVFYTATYTAERDREFALKLGAEQFIIKPEEPERFLTIVNEVLNQVEGLSPLQVKLAAKDMEVNDSIYLNQYNEVLIHKLETKMELLERTNRELEQDIAARKQVEEALRESEELFRSLVESAPEGIFVQSQGRFLYLNPAILKLLGASRAEELLGQYFTKVIAPEYQDLIAQRIQFQRQTGKAAPLMDQAYLRLDGTRVPVETTAVPIRFMGREAHLVFVRDITARKQGEAELQRVFSDLERSNLELEQFASLASHDLQEPLRMISCYTQLLTQRYEKILDEESKQYAYYVVDGALRMQKLIKDLLAYSRIDSRFKPDETVNAHEALTLALRNLSALLEKDKVIVTYDKLPMVLANDSLLVQIFQNLIANGIKFRSREKPVIHVSAREQGNMWCFAVRDNGIGIDDKYAQRIFEIFQRLHTRQEYEGTGIGLAICKRIIERLGGDIWVQSEPGKGATFFFTLPKAAKQAEKGRKPTGGKKRAAQSQCGKGGNSDARAIKIRPAD